jgi:hypothetical protein
VKQKVRSGRLAPNFFKIDLNDLALDCIADLFKRDEDGAFPQLYSYYSRLISPSSSKEELFILTRKLIFSKVNQEIFRLYSDEDPGLSKIIRNLKRTLKFVPQLLAERRNGDIWIYLDDSDPELPIMPPEYMEARLSEGIASNPSFKCVLTTLCNVLNGQNEFRKMYPIMGIAIICRSLFLNLLGNPADYVFEEEGLRPDEINLFIQDSIRIIRKNTQNEYISKGKLSTYHYECYFKAMHQILIAQYVHNNGFDKSFYEYLSSFIRNLTPEIYKSEHRSMFEYFIKLTRNQLLKIIRQEL